MTTRHILLSLSCVFVAGYAFSVGEAVGNAIALKTDHDCPELSSDPLQLAERPAFKGKATCYSGKYEGRGMNGGGVFRHSNPKIVAVPVKGKRNKRDIPILPFGTKVKITVRGKSIICVVSDTCPGGTWDLSRAGWKALGFSNPNQKLPCEVVVL